MIEMLSRVQKMAPHRTPGLMMKMLQQRLQCTSKALGCTSELLILSTILLYLKSKHGSKSKRPSTWQQRNDGCKRWDIGGLRNCWASMLMATSDQMLFIIVRRCSCPLGPSWIIAPGSGPWTTKKL